MRIIYHLQSGEKRSLEKHSSFVLSYIFTIMMLRVAERLNKILNLLLKSIIVGLIKNL